MDVYMPVGISIRRRIRWTLGALALVALVSFMLSFNHLARLSHEADLRDRYVLDAGHQYASAAKRARTPFGLAEELEALVAERDPSDRVLVPSAAISDLERDLRLHTNLSMPDETYELAGQTLRVDVAAFSVILAPPVFLVILIGTLREEGRLHRKLAPAAQPGSDVQLLLNSVYFDRVTDRYLEGWRRHAFTGGAVVLLLVVLPVFALSPRSTIHLDKHVAVDADGFVYPARTAPWPTPLVLDPDQQATGVLASILATNLVLWTVLMWTALRRVPVRESAGASEPPAVNPAVREAVT